MKVFHCGHCGQLVFFENTSCLNCGHLLAFLPETAEMASLEPAGEGIWRPVPAIGPNVEWRLCSNYSQENVCNWAIPADDPDPLCASCRLTRVIPNIGVPGRRDAWCRLETAKRRLIFTLQDMHLPLATKVERPDEGLAFELLEDDEQSEQPVLSGHSNGVITINIAEADDAERERRRNLLHEPYRTLLGHFRHEIGHYYWDRFIRDSERLSAFREQFGDEQSDYGQALQVHYDQGPPPDWQQRFVSAYASSHPWEDWAETWAHYLHMSDALQMARSCGLLLRPTDKSEPTVTRAVLKETEAGSFDHMIEGWFPLTYMINNINRGLGLADGYPFVLSPPVIDKLRFVHETIFAAGNGSGGDAVTGSGVTSSGAA